MLGLPSCVSDDWVTASASHPSTAAADPLISLDPDVSKLLRIQRFALRLSTVMGHSVRSKSGQDASTGPALIGILASELVDIENGLSPMNPRVAIAFLEVKLQLYTYGLQDDMMLASPMDLLSCYTSSIRMLEILHKLAAAPDTNAAFWPRSMLLSTVYATLCLLKLASLQTTHPQKFTVDRNMILREIMRAYDLLKGRSLTPGDEADQVCQIIRFLSRRLANSPPSSSTTSTSSTPAAPPKRPAMYVRARMSLGGLLYDAVYETIIAGPWGAKLQPGALRTLPGAAGCCGLTDADETVEREERERAETQAQVRAQPVVPQVAGMQAAPTVHAAAQELPMLSTSTSDLDVFGWLNGMDTTSYDELINDVANFGAFGTSWMMGDLSAMQMG
ncbi:hypothetical protein PUNSTDRAFT_116966 [Punctularia strigosozonata HHB-11173 SS5]|uniref:Uncharacterized protein n=1 Tax=Punctularia strigosozonata (strain HHB-11173) TaxID=741275 RepID=R7S1A1_PUNST|nr:uncharacterized protein PUNSTDRAFT_116966 [Punctularia strigosozonata HHB-11173 SS5]EIN03567.1 hypothetical protein PUNSTDRAFT_116966 [Punctularia strigosozonata HHB-11173 SS5]